MRIAVISDELSDDLEGAIQLGTQLGIRSYELRWVRLPGTFMRRRLSDLSSEDAAPLSRIIRQHEVTVSAISSGIFHSACTEDELKIQFSRLERCCRLAEAFQTQNIIIHGFLAQNGRRNGVCPAQVIDCLGRAAQWAGAQGFHLLLRNTPDCYADTGTRSAAIVCAVNSPALSVSWDPCSAFQAGEDAASEGYDWVSPFVRDVRVRDQKRRAETGMEDTVLGQGDVEWPAIAHALARDGYQGTLTLGTHLEPRLLNTLHSIEAIHKLLPALKRI